MPLDPYLSEQGANGSGLPALHVASRQFQENVVQVCKITNFDRQTALFDGASMGAIA
jgi:hypothetical protein